MSTNNDMEFHNWVKACLAIKCVRNGIIPLLEKHCKEHYSNNTDQVLNVCGLPKYSCNQCDVTKLEPYHKHSRTKCGYRKCACKEKNMNMKPCTENLACGVIYDQIKAAHINNDPSWSNTNCDKWSSSAWEQMKCYISTPGYKEKADISCADLTALIQICLNYIPLRTLFNQNIIDLDEVRRCRNDIYHSSTMELANDRLNYFLSTMKTFLKLRFFQDFKAEVDCQLEQLSKLEKDEFEVSIENEIAARKDALDGIQESMADMQRSFSQMKDQLEEINKRTADQCLENREIKQHLSAQTKNINSIQETQASISESVSDLQTNIRESSEKTDSRYGEIIASNGLILANQREILARIDQLNELFQKQTPDAKETLKTDIVTKINVKPTHAKAGNTVSEEMCTAGNEIINSFNGDSADNPLKRRLKDVVEQLQEGNNKVTAFKQKCLEIYISSPTVQSWVTLNKAFFNGTIEKAFLPVQTYLRTRHGCGNLTLTIELDQDCFNKCANTIIINLDRMFNNQQTEDHPYKVTETLCMASVFSTVRRMPCDVRFESSIIS
ncbi:uncharacterized protein CXorf38 homolog [Dreissena polymorpha]|uniref:uncharacterized protein CXorf38 homolog n=1 Tax=Dreissena polymorpha TaxID=45954 RepID=UPI00226470AB|nr:uncharacterized protein CXorf38 homolog [Dreissena polymorpha]